MDSSVVVVKYDWVPRWPLGARYVQHNVVVGSCLDALSLLAFRRAGKYELVSKACSSDVVCALYDDRGHLAYILSWHRRESYIGLSEYELKDVQGLDSIVEGDAIPPSAVLATRDAFLTDTEMRRVLGKEGLLQTEEELFTRLFPYLSRVVK